MTWVSGITVYVCIWWIVIFAVLPIGVKTPEPGDPAYRVGAPARPMLWRKVLITTIVAAILWIGADLVILSDLFSLRE